MLFLLKERKNCQQNSYSSNLGWKCDPWMRNVKLGLWIYIEVHFTILIFCISEIFIIYAKDMPDKVLSPRV